MFIKLIPVSELKNQLPKQISSAVKKNTYYDIALHYETLNINDEIHCVNSNSTMTSNMSNAF
jgi:hypothetical protein